MSLAVTVACVGDIVPAIDKEERNDISYPEDGSSLESSGSAHQTGGYHISEDILSHYGTMECESGRKQA